ncbi:MAG: hypothetical protein ABF391_06165 [Akkermansiaceae bacterium]
MKILHIKLKRCIDPVKAKLFGGVRLHLDKLCGNPDRPRERLPHGNLPNLMGSSNLISSIQPT